MILEDGFKTKQKKNPDLSTLILKTMQSETHIFFFGLIDMLRSKWTSYRISHFMLWLQCNITMRSHFSQNHSMIVYIYHLRKKRKKKCFLVDIFICLCYHSNSAEKCFIGSGYTCNNECCYGNPLASISTYCWHGNKIKYFFLSCIKGQKYHIVC